MDKESDWAKRNCFECGNSVEESCGPDCAIHPTERQLKEKDKKLLNYLATHNHWTPFSHPQITMRETVPIFVARQRFKHMVGFTYNEVSRRYVDDRPELFDVQHRLRPEGSIKQGSRGSTNRVPSVEIAGHSFSIMAVREGLLNWYEDAVGEDYKISPETARAELPQSMYTSYYVTGSLAAWARAYKQRIDAHAQVEIQELAKQWCEILAPLYPESWKALTK